MGVMHSDAFFVVPREDALLTTQLNNADFCSQTVQSAKSLLQIQKKVGGKSTERGVHRLTFTDNKDGVINYATIGCQARRNSHGVDHHTFHVRHDPMSVMIVLSLLDLALAT